MTLEIVHYPHPALAWKSKSVKGISQQLRDHVRQMFELMYAARGIGLAANQVALPWRVFVVNLTCDPAQTEEEFVFINPEIVRRKGSEEDEEGCLSLPEVFGQVRRAENVVVEAYDLEGIPFQVTLTDMAARVVQHENDHLDGVLFIERMSEGPRRELDPKILDFEDRFRREQQAGKIPSDDEIRKRLKSLEP
ncbi:MAG: peptide deformylase [Planctomycetaceae bacterium]